jgi:hypothetical protein
VPSTAFIYCLLPDITEALARKECGDFTEAALRTRPEFRNRISIFEFFDLAPFGLFAEEYRVTRLPLDAFSMPCVRDEELKDTAACAASETACKEVAELTSDANLCAMDRQ